MLGPSALYLRTSSMLRFEREFMGLGLLGYFGGTRTHIRAADQPMGSPLDVCVSQNLADFLGLWSSSLKIHLKSLVLARLWTA